MLIMQLYQPKEGTKFKTSWNSVSKLFHLLGEVFEKTDGNFYTEVRDYKSNTLLAIIESPDNNWINFRIFTIATSSEMWFFNQSNDFTTIYQVYDEYMNKYSLQHIDGNEFPIIKNIPWIKK